MKSFKFFDLPFKSWIQIFFFATCGKWKHCKHKTDTFPQCKVIMVNYGTRPADTKQPDACFFTLVLDLIWSESTPGGNICLQLLTVPLCSSLVSVCVCCLFEQVVYGGIFELFFSWTHPFHLLCTLRFHIIHLNSTAFKGELITFEGPPCNNL